jgi:hypothetical protein
VPRPNGRLCCGSGRLNRCITFSRLNILVTRHRLRLEGRVCLVACFISSRPSILSSKPSSQRFVIFRRCAIIPLNNDGGFLLFAWRGLLGLFALGTFLGRRVIQSFGPSLAKPGAYWPLVGWSFVLGRLGFRFLSLFERGSLRLLLGESLRRLILRVGLIVFCFLNKGDRRKGYKIIPTLLRFNLLIRLASSCRKDNLKILSGDSRTYRGGCITEVIRMDGATIWPLAD